MEQKTWNCGQALWSRDPVPKDPARRLEREGARKDCECKKLNKHYYLLVYFLAPDGPKMELRNDLRAPAGAGAGVGPMGAPSATTTGYWAS